MTNKTIIGILTGLIIIALFLACLGLFTSKALAAPPERKVAIFNAVPKASREPMPEPEPELIYAGRYYITGYDICLSCCGKTDGITASGAQATVGRTCAMSGVAFGTRVWIDGIGERVVEDRGGGVSGQHIDVLCADHPACYAITGYYDVYFVEEDKP